MAMLTQSLEKQRMSKRYPLGIAITLSALCALIPALPANASPTAPVSAPPSLQGQCSVAEDGNSMFVRFIDLWLVDPRHNSGNDVKIRRMTAPEKLEAMDCLRKSADLNNCMAVQLLINFYRSGNEVFGIEKDDAVADDYKQRLDLCFSKKQN